MAGFKPHHLGALAGTAYVWGRGVLCLWLGRMIYQKIKSGPKAPGARNREEPRAQLVVSPGLPAIAAQHSLPCASPAKAATRTDPLAPGGADAASAQVAPTRRPSLGIMAAAAGGAVLTVAGLCIAGAREVRAGDADLNGKVGIAVRTAKLERERAISKALENDFVEFVNIQADPYFVLVKGATVEMRQWENETLVRLDLVTEDWDAMRHYREQHGIIIH